MTTQALHALFLRHPTISTDSRNIPAGGMFFALRGDNFNGNRFAHEALEKGAAYAVVDEEEFVTCPQTIRVDNVLVALQLLATHHRQHCGTRVIALTGSNGKTTTKELIAAVLSTTYRTIATRGNLNNHIGVPLTLLRLREDTEMAVVEMGANHQGEIAFLAGVAQPDFGYITNFGKAHLEGFGGVEGVIRGKSELYDYLQANGKTIFFNADDPIQAERLSGYPTKAGFGTRTSEFVHIPDITSGPYVQLRVAGTDIRTQLSGQYNFTNCAAAARIGLYFDVAPEAIKNALESYVPSNMRSQQIRRGTLDIILDAYNANPTSMAAALGHMHSLDAPRKIAILGDMFELGVAAGEEHRSVGKLALSLGLDQVFLVGSNFAATGLPTLRYPDYASLEKALKTHPIQGPATVLIKGSRGMALERVVDLL